MKQETIRQLIEAFRDDTQYKPTDICKSPMFFLDADAGKMIADALEKTRWVPCEERLPEKNDSYLVTSKHGFVSIAEWDDAESSGSWHGKPTWVFEELSALSTDGYAVAWMPIPKPYATELSE